MLFLETHGYDTCVDCHNLLSSFGYEVERFPGSGTLVALKPHALARSPLRHAAENERKRNSARVASYVRSGNTPCAAEHPKRRANGPPALSKKYIYEHERTIK